MRRIGANRAGRRLLRIRGAHDVAILLYRILAFEHLHDHGPRGHVPDEVGEERSFLVHGIEALGLLLRETHHPGGDDTEPAFLETPDDFTDEILRDAVGLDDR